MSDPLLVASADGVGTKVKVAIAAGVHGTVGQDLVNHCVNDILVQGASPLFFLDYIATGKMRPEIVGEILEGLAKACRENGCALLGGETAEMPGMYAEGDYDLAGTIVGVVDRPKLLDGSQGGGRGLAHRPALFRPAYQRVLSRQEDFLRRFRDAARHGRAGAWVRRWPRPFSPCTAAISNPSSRS